jgi:hypothetical protein
MSIPESNVTAQYGNGGYQQMGSNPYDQRDDGRFNNCEHPLCKQPRSSAC